MRHITENDPTSVPWWTSFVFKFVVVNITVVTCLFGILLYSTDAANRRQVAHHFAAILKTIVTNGAPAIRGESLNDVRTNADIGQSAFKNAKAVLRRLQQQNQLAEDGIYILRPEPSDPNVYRFVVMLQERTFVGDPYRPPDNLRQLYETALSGRAVESPIYVDEHGSFISGVAPIYDRGGRVVALLQADIRLAQYLAQVANETRQLMYIAAAIMLVLLIFG
ncbi:MAG: hypothetical protein VX589_19070, partial [Myxococcota bacterium]|nr:hypothetical protein [Myxococcota bacterium]